MPVLRARSDVHGRKGDFDLKERYKIWVVWWADDCDPDITVFTAEHRAHEYYERIKDMHMACGIDDFTIYPEVKVDD